MILFSLYKGLAPNSAIVGISIMIIIAIGIYLIIEYAIKKIIG
ncbi:hypothetical protein [Methanocaldococcus jannaschii]|nr:hypothetical protein [Methanocaldococcus jannaschii]